MSATHPHPEPGSPTGPHDSPMEPSGLPRVPHGLPRVPPSLPAGPPDASQIPWVASDTAPVAPEAPPVVPPGLDVQSAPAVTASAPPIAAWLPRASKRREKPSSDRAASGDAEAVEQSAEQPRPKPLVERVPAWLVSTVLHTLLLLFLMLWHFPAKRSGLLLFSQIQSPSSVPQTIEQLKLPVDLSPDQSLDEDAVALDLPDAPPVTEQRIVIPTLDLQSEMTESSQSAEGRQQLARQLQAALTPGPTLAFVLPAGGMAPRTAQSRAELGAMYGATPESEHAVELALAWLAEHQQRNGAWSFDLTLQPCGGRCRHSRIAGDNTTPSTAATGLALLAFLGAGYTHHEGKYTETVRRGIYYLRDEARPAKFGRDLQAGSMYGHGIATLALTEALAIDRYNNQEDQELRELVEDVIKFTIAAQHEKGGWRYRPGSPGDMTVTGWQIFSLVSARYGGVPLPTTTLWDAKGFVRSLSADHSYEFGYLSSRPAQPTTTAIGLCMLMFLGDSPQNTPYAMALQRMADRRPKLTDVYHDYYATVALHNARHPAWPDWHQPLRDYLVRHQEQARHERGSWHFADPHGDVGGRLYSTAMAVLILEVYYRHLPLYQDRTDFDYR